MQSSDLIKSPSSEGLTRSQTLDPDRISVSFQIRDCKRVARKRFEGFFHACRGDLTGYYKEVLKIHKEVGTSIEQIQNDKSREENLKDLWAASAQKINELMIGVDGTRSLIEERIEEVSSLIYNERRDRRFPRSIRFGCDVNREVTFQTEEEAQSFLKWARDYQGILFQMLSEVDGVLAAHKNFTLSHRSANLDKDDEAWLAYQQALRQVFEFTNQ
jgi:hypothetical protein